MQLERNLSDLGKVPCAIGSWCSFTTGHSCLGTLNCLFFIIKEWAIIIARVLAYFFFKGRSHLHWRNVGYLSRRVSALVLPFVCSQNWCLPSPIGKLLRGRECHHEKGNCNILAPGWALSVCPFHKARGIYARKRGRGALTA